MAINIEHRWCAKCQANVRAERHSVNHILHLLLACITFGIWIPIWFMLAIGRTYRCTACGSKTSAGVTGGVVAAVIFAVLLFSFLGGEDGASDPAPAKYVVTARSVIYNEPNVPLPNSFARQGLELPDISESRDGFSKFIDVEASGRKQTFWLRDSDFDPAQEVK